MSTNDPTAEESTDLEPRTRRALTQFMAVLSDVGRARDADDLYVVVSESGSEYMVDLREGTCECPDSRHRDNECKHVRRARIATGARPVTADALLDVDPDPQLGAHVDADGPRAVATDGGRMEWADTPDYTEHVESVEQGAEPFIRCEGCGRELLVAYGGREALPHVDGCPNGDE